MNAFLCDRWVKKLLLTMKLIALFLLLGFMQVSATVYSQATKFNFKAENKQIADVLKEIEKSSDFRFFYIREQVNVERQVSLSAENSTVEEILNEMFNGQEITWKVLDDNAILLRPGKNGTTSIQMQQNKVSGVVTDNVGEPLPGVTVVVKGTTQGTVTDFNGKYTLINVADDAILQFSFVGMKAVEVSVEGKTTLNVTMKESTIGVDEVVVVGYGTQKKVNLTGSVGSVGVAELAERPVQNASQILQGLIPGLNITQSEGGGLDTEPDINIRGVTTIGEGSTGSPLVLIDGVEGNINALNPQDIENVSVLKDAAASSIYGSRAPFGVILITTKSGEEGKTTINYNNNFRWSSPIVLPNVMDSYNFCIYYNEAYVNGGASAYFDEERLQRILDYQNGVIDYETVRKTSNSTVWDWIGNSNINWYDEYFKDYSFSQEHNISASGGNRKLQFYFSGNYMNQNGLIDYGHDDFNRYGTTLKVTGKLNEWFSLDVASRFVREETSRPSYLDDNFFYSTACVAWPTMPKYDPNGYLANGWAYRLRDGGEVTALRDWLYQKINLTIEPVKNWKTHLDFNYRTRNYFTHTDYQTLYGHDIYGKAYVDVDESSVAEYGMRQYLMSINAFSEYVKNFNSGHNIKGMIGFQAEEGKYKTLYAQRDGIIISGMPVLNLTSGTDSDGNTVSPYVAGSSNSWATSGFFGRLNYDYKGKYLFEANLRYDGTSRFREYMRWRWFPSASAGWNIAKENFWSPLKNKISMMKLRVSYGELGNQNTSSIYPTYLTMSIGTASGNWLINGEQPNTAYPPGLITQSLTWEKINSWNMGLDMTLFDNRLNISYDYFVRKTLDMMGPAPELPSILGTDEPTANNTDLKTYGFELSVSWKDRLENGIGYSARFMLSDSQTEITSYPNETNDLSTYCSGYKMNNIWGFETIGIAKTQNEMDTHLESLPEGGQDAIGNNWAAGDIMYKDLNDDGKIDYGAYTLDDRGDLKIIGNSTPRYRFALDLSANWKGFDVRALFQGVMKRDYFQNSSFFWGAYSYGIWKSTAFEEHKDFFRDENSYSYDAMGENLDAYYPRPIFGNKNQKTQTRYLLDASYIRLKNLQIGYSIPSELANKIGMSQLRVFLSGENLWTGTKVPKMFDPEYIEGGSGGNAYPLSKVYSIGVNVNF